MEVWRNRSDVSFGNEQFRFEFVHMSMENYLGYIDHRHADKNASLTKPYNLLLTNGNTDIVNQQLYRLPCLLYRLPFVKIKCSKAFLSGYSFFKTLFLIIYDEGGIS